MMPKSLVALLLAAALAPAAHAQSLDDVLAKCFQAQGGLDKLKKVQTVRMVGRMQVGPGMEAPITLDKKRPKLELMEFVFSGMTGLQGYDGQRGWQLMPFMGQKTAEPLSEDDSKLAADQADFDGPLVDWKAKGNTVELAGKESVDGADAYKLKVTHKSGRVEYYYVDAETYLVVKREGKQVTRGTEMETETSLGDYKEVAGLMFPYSITMGAKGSERKQSLTIDSIAVDVPMDDSHFAMPAPPDTSKAAAPAAPAAKPADAPKKK